MHKATYYNINASYLRKIFTDEELKRNKYLTRPFIGFDKFNILIVLPEQTIHSKKRYQLCYYFSDKRHMLSISSLLFVPESERYPSKSWNSKIEFKNKLLEVQKDFHIIQSKINKCLSLNDSNQKFKDAHKQISKSKHVTFEILKLKSS